MTLPAQITQTKEDHFSAYSYGIILPKQGSDYAQQAADIVSQIKAEFDAQGKTVVRQVIFLRDPERLDEVAALFAAQYAENTMPQTAYVSQAPADGGLLAAEITAVKNAEVNRISEGLTTVRHNDITFVHTHADALQGGKTAGLSFDDTLGILNDNIRLLAQGGAKLSQVFRTWFYMGSIVAPDSRTSDGIQRYKELNRARTVAFDGTHFLRESLSHQPEHDVYPASTGIGMGGEDVVLSSTALLTERKDVFTVPLENPRQTPAFDYGRHYSPETPKFARAMAVVHDNQATVYISGTASITASETQHIGNPEKQTEETLINIAALISSENFANAGFAGYGAGLQDLAVVRAYVKNIEDYETVRRVCEQQLIGVPVVYTIGDVCRDDLLVELEAVVHIQKNA